MRKWIICLILVLLSFPIVWAADGCVVATNCTWWAAVTNNTDFYNADEANITIYYPDETVYIENASMEKTDTGRFRYISNSNTTGNYMAYVQYFGSGVLLATAFESKELRDVNEELDMLDVAIVLGLAMVAFIFIFASSSIKTEEVPKKRVPEKVILYFGALAVSIAIIFVIYNFISNSTRYTALASWSGTFLIIVVFIVVALMWFYFVYLIELIFRASKIKEKEKEDELD